MNVREARVHPSPSGFGAWIVDEAAETGSPTIEDWLEAAIDSGLQIELTHELDGSIQNQNARAIYRWRYEDEEEWAYSLVEADEERN